MLSGASRATGAGATVIGNPSQLDPDLAVLVVAVWLVIAVGVAALWTEQAEISG